MEILLWFQNISSGFWDIIFKIFTLMGEEYFVMAIFCWFAWCSNKEFAHRLSFAFCFGMGINQVLKIIFCIQRPWILDSRIKASDHALESATGYSFPSGHTQSGMTLFTAFAKAFGKWGLKILFILCGLAVGVSRLYFRVHTIWDVLVSIVIGVVIVFVTDYIYKFFKNHDITALVTLLLLSFAMVAFTILKPYPQYHLPEYAYDCIKIAGAIGGCITGWFIERRYINYLPTGKLPGKIFKAVIGIALLIGIKLAMEIIPDGNYALMYAKYFILILWCLGLYPAILKFGDVKKVRNAKKQ